MSRYNTIYGSFAALPLFLLLAEISWMIILAGAEISYANQNYNKFEFKNDSFNLSFRLKKILSLHLMHTIISRFVKEEKPLTSEELSKQLRLPLRITEGIIADLVNADLIAEVHTGEEKIFCLHSWY